MKHSKKQDGFQPATLLSLRDTFLGEILSIKPEEFILPDYKINKGEKIIGEINDFEKACITYSQGCLKKISDLCHKAEDADIPFHSVEGKAIRIKAKIISESAKLALELVWKSVHQRVADKLINGKCSGIRAGGKIVSFDKNIESDHMHDQGFFSFPLIIVS